jgi:hypothetical protein
VTSILASNQKNLARTLRSTPGGVANYFQTTAWGEWFNVRLVELVLQDGESNDLVRVRENEDLQRCENCGGRGQGSTEQVSRDGSSGGAGAGAGAPSENVGSLLRYTLTGDER